jgi:hypothetical protein
MDRRLIEVRLARLAGSNEKALDMLLEAVNREGQWKTEPGGKVAFTQNEEIGYGMGFAEKTAAEAAARKVPLRGEYFLLKYRKLFEGGEVARRFEAARSHTKVAGKLSCQSLLPSAPPAAAGGKKKKGAPDPVAELATRHPYYYLFARSYCDYWGVATPEPPAVAEKFHEGYTGRIQVSALGVTNLQADLRVFIADGARAAFERTAWYDAGGTQSLDVNVGGGYTYADSRQPQSLKHVYTESVPYTEYVEVRKSKEVPYTATEGVFDPVSKLTKPHEVTRYRTEYYNTSEPQTRYRDVQRTFHYQGFQHDRKLTLALSSQVALEKHPLQLELSEVSRTGGIEHDENQPSIGLRPEHPALEDPPGWLRTQSNRFVAQFEQKLANLWRETYCAGTGNEDLAVSGDSVQKCLRQRLAETPSFADAWYQKNLGVSVREALSVLGDRR